MKYCCNECKNKECPVNYKNAPKGAKIKVAALCGSKRIKAVQGLQATVERERKTMSERREHKGGTASVIIIAFYRDKDGKIVRHHDARGHTLEEMEKLAEKYNQNSEKNGQTVYVEAVEDNSLMAYLFRKAEERKKHNKEYLRYVVECAEAALDAVRGLEE